MTDDKNPIRDFAAELRQELGREVREEAAEDEKLTELLRQRQSTITDHVSDLAHRGARVTAEFSGHTFSGAVVASGDDYATIAGPGQLADITLGVSIWTETSQGVEVPPLLNPPTTFRGVLHAHASTEQMLRFILPSNELLIGKVAVVADDHLRIEDADGRQKVVPTSLILGVIRSTDLG